MATLEQTLTTGEPSQWTAFQEPQSPCKFGNKAGMTVDYATADATTERVAIKTTADDESDPEADGVPTQFESSVCLGEDSNSKDEFTTPVLQPDKRRQRPACHQIELWSDQSRDCKTYADNDSQTVFPKWHRLSRPADLQPSEPVGLMVSGIEEVGL